MTTTASATTSATASATTTYPRPAFGDPTVKTASSQMSVFFGGGSVEVPVIEYPITIRENFRRAAKRDNPLWVPNSITEIDSEMVANLTGWGEADWTRTDRYDYQDQFGVWWTFVPEAGGPMLKLGTQFMDDITEWREKVKFPDLSSYNIKERCEAWVAKRDPNKVMQVNIGLGCTERLVALMGGYSDAMVAMALEPEAVREFFEAFADSEIRLIDELTKYLPLDFITYHDDWGTERDTFFSEGMFLAQVYKPTRRIIEHVRSKGVIFQMHSCGNVTRFLPHIAEMGAEFVQLQSRAVDFIELKRKFGDKTGLMVGIEGIPFGETVSDEQLVQAVRQTVDTYAKGGGCYVSLGGGDPRQTWVTLAELFAYSREFYERN